MTARHPNQPSAHPRFGLVWCTNHDWSRYQKALIGTFSAPGEDWTIIDAPGGDLKKDWSGLNGFLIGGSEHSMNDDTLQWRTDLVQLLNRCREDGTPVVGICFGAQALAYALGGRVAGNPSTRFTFLTEVIRLEPPLAEWFRRHDFASPELVESHGDCISQLPTGAVYLADSETARHEIFTIGATMVAVQGHPEIGIDLALEEILPAHLDAGLLDADESEQSRAQLRRSHPQIDGTVALCRSFLCGQGTDFTDGI